jgi:hypothetical protein
MNSKKMFLWAAITMIILLALSAACRGASDTNTSKPVGGAVVNSDSIVKATIKSITAQSSGYSWTLDVLIQSTQDVDSLVNPVKDSVGKIVTVFTDQDMKPFKVNDVVTAKIKYTGDVNIPGGIRMYMYDIV